MNPNRYAHLAPLLLRITVGAVFVLHGLPKLTNPAGVAGFFGGIGIPFPYAMAIWVGVVEVVGGALLLAGYGVRIASLLLAFTMLVAIVTAKRGRPFVGGWEYEAVLLAAALSLFLSGPIGQRDRTEDRI